MAVMLNDILAGGNPLQAKADSLATTKQDKIQQLSDTTPIIVNGFEDADTVTTTDGNIRMVAADGKRYDATETVHGGKPLDMYGSKGIDGSKSQTAMSAQRAQVAKMMNKPESQVTQQDFVDVANYQTVQMASDVINGPGVWQAPLGKGTDPVNLTGRYKDPETSKVLDAPLEINATVQGSGLDKYKRKLGTIGTESGIDVTTPAAYSPERNAFANSVLPQSTDLYGIGNRKISPVTGDLTAEEVNKYSAGVNDMTVLGRFGNTGKAIADSAIKSVYDVADVGAELVGSDLGTEEQKSKQINKLTGYEPKYTQQAQEIVANEFKRMNKDGVDAQGVWKVLSTGVNTPEFLGESLGFLATLAVGGPTSAVGKSVVAANRAVKAAELAGDAAKVMEAKTALTAAKEAYTSTKQAIDFVSKNAGLLAVSEGMASNDLDKYAEEAGIKKSDIGADKLVGAYLGSLLNNSIDRWTDMGILKSPEMAAGIASIVKGMTTKQLDEFGRGMARIGTSVVTSGVKEGSTEYVQQFLQQINEQVGDKTGKTILDAWNDEKNKLDRSVAGALGVTGAQQINIVSVGGQALKSGTQVGVTKMLEAIDNRDASTIQEQATSIESPIVETQAPAVEASDNVPEVQPEAIDRYKIVEDAIAENKFGTAYTAFSSLIEDAKTDTTGTIDRDKLSEYATKLETLQATINKRIEDNGGKIDEDTAKMFGSDADSMKHILKDKTASELETIAESPTIVNKPQVMSRLQQMIAERKTLEQVNRQVSEDFKKNYDTYTTSVNENEKSNAQANIARLTSNQVDKLATMKSAVEELEQDIRGHMTSVDKIDLNDYKGAVKGTYPAGGTYEINRKDVAKKVQSEIEGTPYEASGIYKIIDVTTAEVAAAKKITDLVMGKSTVAPKPASERLVKQIQKLIDSSKSAKEVMSTVRNAVYSSNAERNDMLRKEASKIARKLIVDSGKRTKKVVVTEQVKDANVLSKDLGYLTSDEGKQSRIDDVGEAKYAQEVRKAKKANKQAQRLREVAKSMQTDEDTAASAVRNVMTSDRNEVDKAKDLLAEDIAELPRMYEEQQASETSVVDDGVSNELVDEVVVEDTEVSKKKGEVIVESAKLYKVGSEQVNLLDRDFVVGGRAKDFDKLTGAVKGLFDRMVKVIGSRLDAVVTTPGGSWTWVHAKDSPMLLLAKDGKTIEFTTEVKEAYTYAINKYMATRVATLNKPDAIAARSMLGLEKGSRIPTAVVETLGRHGKNLDNEATTIGRMVYEELGLKARDTAAYDTEAKMITSLGMTALMVMEANGDVKFDDTLTVSALKHYVQVSIGGNALNADGSEVKVNGNSVKATLRNVPKGDSAEKVWTVALRVPKNKALIDRSKRAKGIDDMINSQLGVVSDRGYRTEKNNKRRGFKTRNAENWTNITKNQWKALNKAENTAYKPNVEAISTLVAMWGEDVVDENNEETLTSEQKALAALFGYNDDYRGVHIDDVAGVRASNEGIVDSIKALVKFADGYDGSDVYFDYFFSKNGRFFIDGGDINPQTDKLHRFLITVDAKNKVVDDSSRDVFKWAVVQAFDGSSALKSAVKSDGVVDESDTEFRGLKSTDKQGHASNMRQFAMIMKTKVISDAVEAIASNANDKNAKVMAALQGVDHPGHALAALYALTGYSDSGTFETTLTMEMDGVTSGFLLGMLTNPLMEFGKLVQWLAKGGVWFGDSEYVSYGDWKEAGNKDAYETGAEGVNRLLLTKAEGRLSFVSWMKDVDRSFMKNPLMIFVYGAGAKRIGTDIATGMSKKVLAEFSAVMGISGSDRSAVQAERREVAGKSFTALYSSLMDEKALLTKRITEAKKSGDKHGKSTYELRVVNEALSTMTPYRDSKDGSGYVAFANKIRNGSLTNDSSEAFLVSRAVEMIAKKTYGDAVAEYLSNEFDELVSMRRTMNTAFGAMFEVFKNELDREIAAVEAKTGNKITTKELDLVIADLVDGGKVPGIMTVEATNVDEKAPVLKKERRPSRKVDNVQVAYKPADGTKTVTRTLHPLVYELIANNSAGSVINIHYLDGAIIGKIIADGTGLGVHDAYVVHVNDAVKAMKKYNKNVLEMTQAYDMVNRVLTELEKVHKRAPNEVEAYYRRMSIGEYEVTYETDAKEVLEGYVQTINDNKKLISQMKVTVTQMAGPVGGMYVREGSAVDGEKLLKDKQKKEYVASGSKTVDVVGMARDTTGMPKEIADIIADKSLQKECKVKN